MRHHLNIDIETYSDVNITKSGLYKYVESPNFQVLLFAYSLDGAPVEIVDLAQGAQLPETLVSALFDPGVIKHAYNAPFEWFCLSKHFNIQNRNDWLLQWQCTMFHGLYCGYTKGLGVTAKALGFPEDKQKDRSGKALIQYFCVPCKPSKSNGGRTRNFPHHDTDRWGLFKDYCIQDVVVEMEIEKRLSGFPVPSLEHYYWYLDQVMNVRGIRVNTDLITSAIYCNDVVMNELRNEAVELTGLDNPNSVTQMIDWLKTQGVEADNLQKATVAELMVKATGAYKRVLEIRQESAKTSVKKYQAMVETVMGDDRIRGLLQFYGANRTGRWAGRFVQMQNLPRNYLDTLDHARDCVINRNIDALKIVYGNIPDTLSQLIRTAFIPSEGRTFVVSDFSAIEARVIAWLAGEQWRQEVFATHGKIYEASASAMFGVPLEKIKKGNPEYELRQKGKIAELALGYQGSTGALITMGGLNMGLTEDELPDIVSRWRGSNRRIVDLWYKMDNAAIGVLETGQPTGVNGVIFAREGDFENNQDFLTIRLPSRRQLFYVKPFLAPNQWEKPALFYQGMDQKTGKWGVQQTYGGKLVENIVQAIARDCLAVAIDRLAQEGYEVVMSVHDEVIIDCPVEQADLERINAIMGAPIDWAPGLLLNAEGYITNYYKKD
jgi:DNA polymerase